MEKQQPSHLLAKLVHWTLLLGVVASGVLLLAGLVVALRSGSTRLEGPPPSLGRVLRLALRGEGLGLLDLGLLLLLVTPGLRVVMLALGWGWERDWRFLAVAVIVLGLLGLSLVLGVG